MPLTLCFFHGCEEKKELIILLKQIEKLLTT